MKISIGATGLTLVDGNNIASITKSGASHRLNAVKTYDVWGGIRSGAQTAGPNDRYCANLGHVQDDESGLVYMRARYYEPGTGRFVSQDSSMDTLNWYAYCENNPFDLDFDGHYHVGNRAWYSLGQLVGYTSAIAAIICASMATECFASAASKLTAIQHFLILSAIGFAFALDSGTDMDATTKMLWKALGVCVGLLRIITGIAASLACVSQGVRNSLAFTALAATTVYTMMICGALLQLETGD